MIEYPIESVYKFNRIADEMEVGQEQEGSQE